VKVGKVNIYDNFELAGQYNVNTIPRVFIFRGGEAPVRQFVGLTPEKELAEALNEVLAA
jgi:thioredoxin 1